MNCAGPPTWILSEVGCNFSHDAPPLFACQVSRFLPLLLMNTDITGLLPCSIFPKSRAEGLATSFAVGTSMVKCNTAVRELIFSFARIVCVPRLQLVLTGIVTSKVPLPPVVMVRLDAVNCLVSVIGREEAIEGVGGW